MKLSGSFLSGFVVSDQEVRLRFTNGYSLRVFLVEGVVEWGLSGPDSGVVPVQAGGPIVLEWSNGRQTAWDPAGLLDSRSLFVLRRIYAGEMFLNLMFMKGGILQFLPLWNASEQTPLVYLEELEPVNFSIKRTVQ
jgi:hypothetical protein